MATDPTPEQALQIRLNDLDRGTKKDMGGGDIGIAANGLAYLFHPNGSVAIYSETADNDVVRKITGKKAR